MGTLKSWVAVISCAVFSLGSGTTWGADSALTSVGISGPVAGQSVVSRTHPTFVAESLTFPQYGSIGPFGPTTIIGTAEQLWTLGTPAPDSTHLRLTGLINT